MPNVKNNKTCNKQATIRMGTTSGTQFGKLKHLLRSGLVGKCQDRSKYYHVGPVLMLVSF